MILSHKSLNQSITSTISGDSLSWTFRMKEAPLTHSGELLQKHRASISRKGSAP